MTKLDSKLAALYLGAEVQYCEPEGCNNFAKLVGVRHHDDEITMLTLLIADESDGPYYIDLESECVDLLLRPLSEMTEEEEKELGEIKYDVIRFNVAIHAEKTVYLLSKSFDLFGLIDSDLALDITKVKR